MITEEELEEFERVTGMRGTRVHYTDEEWMNLDLKLPQFKIASHPIEPGSGKQIRFFKYNLGDEDAK